MDIKEKHITMQNKAWIVEKPLHKFLYVRGTQKAGMNVQIGKLNFTQLYIVEKRGNNFIQR